MGVLGIQGIFHFYFQGYRILSILLPGILNTVIRAASSYEIISTCPASIQCRAAIGPPTKRHFNGIWVTVLNILVTFRDIDYLGKLIMGIFANS